MFTTLLICSSVLFHASPELNDALSALEEAKDGQRLKVSARVGREAARELAGDGSLSSERLRALIVLAEKGRAHRPLAQALIRRVVAERSLSRAGLSAQALARLDPKLRARLLRTPPKGWAARLELLTRSQDPAVAAASATLLAPHLDAAGLGRLLRRWASDEREPLVQAALEAVATHGVADALATFEALQRLELGTDAAAEALGRALAALVERDADVASAALRAARSPRSGAIVHALSALCAPKQVAEASRIVASLIDPDALEEERIVAAALRTAGELLAPDTESLARILALEKTAPARVRRAAVRALGRLAYRDRPTVQLLIRLLGDTEVASAAHAALVYKTGQRLRGDVKAWQLWARTAKLPATPPEDYEEQLQRARDLRARFARSKVRAAQRAAAKRRAKRGEETAQ